jgi:heterotetrameric sarcosine oxidase gamma subunit
MAETGLQLRSPFAGLIEPGRYGGDGVTLSERSGVALFVISAGAGKAAEIAAKVMALTGLELVDGPTRVSNDGFALIGTAPGQWLAVAEGTAALALFAKLAAGLKGIAFIVDQSDGKAVLRISGPCAREVLAKGCSLDLHPSVFKPGSAGTTPVSLIDCVIWQVDDAPTYDLAVAASFAGSFWSWLTSSAAEYGYTVV